MDVQDRSVRLDVSPVAAPPSPTSKTPSAAQLPGTSPFADSLQRTPQKTPPADQPDAVANGPIVVNTTSDAQPAIAANPSPCKDRTASDAAPVDHTIESLVASLIAATTAAATPPPAIPSGGANKSPPISLVKALQAATEPASDAIAASDEPLPAIPLGLQAGLAQNGITVPTAATIVPTPPVANDGTVQRSVPQVLSAVKADSSAGLGTGLVAAPTAAAGANRPSSTAAISEGAQSDDLSLLAVNGLASDASRLSATVNDSASSAGRAAPADPGVPSVIDQLRPALHQAVANDREMTMTLRPPELGMVRIEVTRQDGLMSARLHTETASAQRLLTEQLPQLRETLAQMGVSADHVQVVRGDDFRNSATLNSRMDGQADAHDSGSRQEPQPQHLTEPQLAEEPERDDANGLGIRTRTALNLRI